MRNRLNVLQILVVLFILQKPCRGVKCYQCRSDRDDNCSNDKVDSKYLKSCPQTHNYCRKANSIYYFTDFQDYIIIRECAKLRTIGKECYQGRYTRGSYQYVCECEGSGCNQSSIFISSLSLIFISQLILVFVLRPL